MEKVKVSESWHGPRKVGAGQDRSLPRYDQIILAPEWLYGPPKGEGGQDGAGGEPKAWIHPALWSNRRHERVHHRIWEPRGSAKHAAPGDGGYHQAGPERGGNEGRACNIFAGVGVSMGTGAGSRVADEDPSIQVNLLQLQKLLLTLVGDHEGHDKFLPAAQNPADEPAPGAPAPQELGAAEEQPGEWSPEAGWTGRSRGGSHCTQTPICLSPKIFMR
uniref:Uncharacterized protein n=1 Tax=Papio anubis TaxID=9555 RepID=A0A8I5N754_PAPAN